MDKKKKGRDVMTIYQELQLSSAGSKNLIRRSENKEEKKRHIFIYNAKVYLVVAFCFAVVTAFSLLFGSANSIAGVARTHLYRIDLRRADCRSAPLQYAATGICVFCKLYLHHDSDGAGLPQCDHVESFYVRSELSAASGLRCQRSRL